MKTCKGCKYANWKRTSNGRLHPDGSGKCAYVVRIPVLPITFRSTRSFTLHGGFIDRNHEWPDHCPTYAPETR